MMRRTRPYVARGRRGDMISITVEADGKVALGDDIIRHLGASAGTRLCVRKLPNGAIALERLQRKGAISDVFGMLSRPGQRPVSIEEMNEVIADGWAGVR